MEVAGGVAYHAALAFEGGPHRRVRRIWEVQIAALFVAGVGLAAWESVRRGQIVWDAAALQWLILAGAFAVGLYAFERLVSRWFARAGLAFDDQP
jgi:hypothetical protein